MERRKKDERAIQLVLNYIAEHLDKSDPEPDFDIYIVWKCKALQNWKYLISTTLLDGMYFELTYNGDKTEWYLDAYKKFQNVVIPDLITPKVTYTGGLTSASLMLYHKRERTVMPIVGAIQS